MQFVVLGEFPTTKRHSCWCTPGQHAHAGRLLSCQKFRHTSLSCLNVVCAIFPIHTTTHTHNMPLRTSHVLLTYMCSMPVAAPRGASPVSKGLRFREFRVWPMHAIMVSGFGKARRILPFPKVWFLHLKHTRMARSKNRRSD